MVLPIMKHSNGDRLAVKRGVFPCLFYNLTVIFYDLNALRFNPLLDLYFLRRNFIKGSYDLDYYDCTKRLSSILK